MGFLYKSFSNLYKQCYCVILFGLLLTILTRAQPKNATAKTTVNSAIPAIFVFGDSTSDTGSNNPLITVFKSNFPPYGKDFPNNVPTGRFSNGKLTADFMASYVGIKEYVPSYLDPNLSMEDLISGVSFASGGSGFDPLTPLLSGVIPLSEQMEQFKQYQKRVELTIGIENTKSLLNNALYVVSAGTNDYVVNYFNLGIVRRINYNVTQYTDFVLEQIQYFLQDLLDQGAKRLAVVGLPPIGCLPLVITFSSTTSVIDRSCLEYYQTVSKGHNQKLISNINSIQNMHGSTLRIAYLDTYGPLLDMVNNRAKYHFKEVNRGCCGTGFYEAAILCTPLSSVCPNASQYIFWDSIHPSERTYYLLFKALQPDIDYLVTG